MTKLSAPSAPAGRAGYSCYRPESGSATGGVRPPPAVPQAETPNVGGVRPRSEVLPTVATCPERQRLDRVAAAILRASPQIWSSRAAGSAARSRVWAWTRTPTLRISCITCSALPLA